MFELTGIIVQKNRFCQVETQNGIFLDQGIENTRMGSEQIEQLELATGSPQEKIAG